MKLSGINGGILAFIFFFCSAALLIGYPFDFLLAQTATSSLPPAIVPPFKPNLEFAQEFLIQTSDTVSVIIPVTISFALLLFLWGMLKFMNTIEDSIAREQGRRTMVRGIVILFVMTAIWTLVALLGYLSGINQGGGVLSPGPLI